VDATLHIFDNNDPKENCTLLGHYAASSGNSLPTFQNNLSVPFSRVKFSTFEYGATSRRKPEVTLDYNGFTPKHVLRDNFLYYLPLFRNYYKINVSTSLFFYRDNFPSLDFTEIHTLLTIAPPDDSNQQRYISVLFPHFCFQGT
jgi:hypothetical protein